MTDKIVDTLTGHSIEPLLQAFVHPRNTDRNIPQKTLSDLEWDLLRDQLAGFAKSDRGYTLLQNLSPLTSVEDATQRLTHIGEWMAASEEDAEPPVYGVRDTEKAVAHAVKHGILEADDLEQIRLQCEIVSRVARYFRNRFERFPNLSALAQELDPLDDLQTAIGAAIEPGGRISDNASPDIRRLRREVQNRLDKIQSRVDQMVKSEKFETMLQDEYFTVRDDRYVLPVRVGQKNALGGVVHGYSQTGQTAYIEPSELVELNNQLQWAHIELAAEERRILDRLTQFVATHAEAVSNNNDLLTYFDLVGSISRFSIKISASVPIISDDLKLKSARHPLLFLKLMPEGEDQLNPTVPNDFELTGDRNVLVVSGPNTGGKTVLLKTIGMCALMVRCGMPIPAEEGSQIPFCNRIFSDIGDGQSIEHDLSTFSSHLTNIQSFIELCNEKSLVLLDELFSGTDPTQGSALATALLHTLALRGSTTVVTTHLDGLKTLALEDDRFANASMGFLIEEMKPTFEMTMGVPGSSFALRIAKRLGFSDQIVDEAESIMAEEGQLDLEHVIVKLEKEVEELKSDRRAIHREREEARTARDKFRQKYKDLLNKERAEINEEAKRLRRKVDDAFDELKKATKRIKKMEQSELTAAREKLREIEQKASDVVSSTKNVDTPDGLEQIAFDDLDIGREFYSTSFRRNGEVIGYNIDGNVTLQLGSLKVTVTVDDLYRPTTPRKAKPEPKPTSFISNGAIDESAVVVQNKQNTCDLRGLRVDDALEKLELFLDAAYLQSLPGVHIIHGHGTGALKRAVRGFLPDANHVRDFRRGERGEGGDGVTVAWIDL